MIRLWARIPCPVQIRAPSVVSIRLRSEPCDAEGVEGVVDGLLVVAAVGGHDPGCLPGPTDDAVDRGLEPGRIGRVPGVGRRGRG